MLRTTRLIASVALALGLMTSAASAEDLPAGFTDGHPVGEEQGTPYLAPAAAPATATAATTAAATTTATTTRYFGAGAYESLRASVVAITRPCTISDDGLTALVLAPVFKESSAATMPSTAPSPMTLSRYDEWNGTYSTSGTPSNNYGLYAFRNPYTAYSRAFWHPGIGIWQYDTAGLGAPLTTVEAMDVGVVAAKAAGLMARNYCAASGSDLNRRYSAWSDWGFPCTLCEGFFQEMMGSSPHFANLQLVDGISALGGTVKRVCSLPGISGTFPCWYVDPSVGVIQGATAWATLSPTGGSGPTSVPTPLSRPFYVIDRGGTEERHWLRADTGYAIDIKASRVIGKDARPRSRQSGSGLTWTSGSNLCDLTAGRGSCAPVAPTGVLSKVLAVSGSSYQPQSLDANGDGEGDVLWYAPGSSADFLWTGTGDGAFASTGVTIRGTYDHVLTGDVDGNGDDDVLFYSTETGLGFLWRSDGDGTFTSVGVVPGRGLVPLLLNMDGDAAQEVFWFGPGTRPDSLWNWNGAGFLASARSVSGAYQPIVGDFDGNQRDDIFWYAPGTTADHLWLHKVAGGYTSVVRSVSGSYEWRVGDYDGDDMDDVLWYAPGSTGDTVWFGGPLGVFSGKSLQVSGTYDPVVLDLFGTGRSVAIWYATGPTPDFIWSFDAARNHQSQPALLPSTHQAVVGPFSGSGADGVVWYGPGSIVDAVWYR